MHSTLAQTQTSEISTRLAERLAGRAAERDSRLAERAAGRADRRRDAAEETARLEARAAEHPIRKRLRERAMAADDRYRALDSGSIWTSVPRLPEYHGRTSGRPAPAKIGTPSRSALWSGGDVVPFGTQNSDV